MRYLVSLWMLCFLMLFACTTASPTSTLPPTPDVPATVEAQVEVALAGIPTATPYPTNTPYPTSTVVPTATPYPTGTAYPTATSRPTFTPYPTLMPLPTHTLYPTATAYPTYTPYPTATHRPTYTPRPTYTRVPTATPTPRPLFPANRTFTVQELDSRSSKTWRNKQPFLLVGCLAQDEPESAHGEVWYTFSFDGRFNEDRYFASVGGFPSFRRPSTDSCYEMVVKYEDSDRYCYWISTGIPIPQLAGHCSGWWQDTPFFYLTNDSAAVHINKSTWRSRYGNRG